ncbi:hypothetical protein [Winogradskyella sp. 4-2091]|uniref:hypothetical protein n=1 Tax=Winogradskyella sp. 4-2091 TaxID=3381659 RepID=UPI0038926199
MKDIITIILSLSIFLFTSISFGQNTVQPEILENTIGEWKGTLTYLDYQTNEPFTMPVNLRIENGKNEYQFKLFLEYPKEQNANSTDKIKISKDGTKVNKADVISNREISEEKFEIITEYSGNDNNKKAEIRVIYIIGKAELIIRKEVKFENTENWILRNEYNYKR